MSEQTAGYAGSGGSMSVASAASDGVTSAAADPIERKK
jgi:hypothetical protein